jgi:hypothetical protein
MAGGQSDIYRAHAARCIKVAQKLDDAESRLDLLNMARAWLALAEQGDKNSRQETLVYETPQPRPVTQQQPQPEPGKD